MPQWKAIFADLSRSKSYLFLDLGWDLSHRSDSGAVLRMGVHFSTNGAGEHHWANGILGGRENSLWIRVAAEFSF
jgi:hypothetical protein